MLDGRYEEGMLVPESVVHAAAVDPHRLQQILNAGGFVPLGPENLHRLFEGPFRIEFAGSTGHLFQTIDILERKVKKWTAANQELAVSDIHSHRLSV